MLGSPATETQITHGRRLWLYVLVGAVVMLSSSCRACSSFR